MQHAIMKFDPATRQSNPYPSHAAQWRDYHGKLTAWLFNPWTGELRSPEMVGSDTFGLLIAPDGASLLADVAGKSDGLAIPAIGDYWQGQGGFYAGVIRGESGQKDRHVIVPTDTLKLKGEWGAHGKEISGADHDYYGMANTVAMAEAGSEIAKTILSMEIEGHNDFYLMARHEARLCYLNVPELFEKEWHWTSTQYSADGAFGQGFNDGGQYYDSKYDGNRVRPVRSFVL